MNRLCFKYMMMLALLLSFLPISAGNRLDEALIKAIEAKDHMKVMALLNSGASADGSEQSPPIFSAVRLGDAKIVGTLLSKGANPDLRLTEMFNATPLMFAAGANRREIATLLLDAGAEIDARDTNGDPAINWAAYYGFTDMTMYLAERGANLKLVGHGNAFEIAMRRGHQDLVAALAPKMKVSVAQSPVQKELLNAVKAGNQEAVVKALKDGASASGLDETGRPILHLAARADQVKITELLLDAGAEVDMVDPIGNTALMEAARDGKSRVVELLITRGANVNHHSRDNGLGLTPLHMAAIGGHDQLVRALVNRGANMNSQGIIGGTPMLWGFFESKISAVLTLIDLGADPYIANRDGISPRTAADQYEVQPVIAKLNALTNDMHP